MINRNIYLEYLANAASSYESNLELITDIGMLENFEKENNAELGIIPHQPFYDIILNLYRDRKTGRIFRYPAFIYGNHGAAIIIILNSSKGRFVLLEKHYREFHQQYSLEICRGYGSLKSAVLSAKLELKEELDIEPSENDKMKLLGKIYPDSGISNNTVEIFSLELDGEIIPKNNDSCEQIDGFEFLPYDDFKNAVKNNIIKDGFTIAAFALYD